MDEFYGMFKLILIVLNDIFFLIFVLQILRFECVYFKNMIYRDIKLENFFIGRKLLGKEKIIYIIDFGFVKEYIDLEIKKYILYREYKSLIGIVRYMSINIYLGKGKYICILYFVLLSYVNVIV